MSEENKVVVRRFFDLLEHELALPEDLLAPDIQYHVPGTPPLDLEAMRMRASEFSSSFSDIHRDVHDLIAEDDRVAFNSTIEMTHSGEYMGIAATGKRLSYLEMGIFRIENGQIAEMWGLSDRLGLMQQIGAPPLP